MRLYQNEEIEKIQKDGIRQDGIRVIGVEKNGGSPADIVEGLQHLKNGGFVAMAGDVVWMESQSTVTGTFLGRNVRIPKAPFALSLASGAPMLVFFAFRTRSGRYRFHVLPPIHVHAAEKSDRSAAIQSAAQQYLQYLEDALHRHPFEWFHFDAFLQ